DVLNYEYAENYPESFDPAMPTEVCYVGMKKLTDPFEVDGQLLDVGQVILSPTRTYLPVLQRLLSTHRAAINGMIHCTGGGQTKVSKFVQQRRIIKDQLFDTPPLFQMIQDQSGTDWKEMYQVFNMGHRLEVYLPESAAAAVIEAAAAFNIPARIIGRVEASEKEEVIIESPYGRFEY
ncbi:MAG: AIR synthase-related protein, partial [Bacteroidota bacterium]